MNPASRQAVAFSPSVDLGLTDIEMANGVDYDEQFDDERAFEMEYEVGRSHSVAYRSSSIDIVNLITIHGRLRIGL